MKTLKASYIILFLLLSALCFGQSNQFFIKVNQNKTMVFEGSDLTSWASDEHLNRFLQELEVSSVEKAFRMNHPELNAIYVIECENKPADFIQKGISSLIYIEPVPVYEHFYTPNDVHANQWNLTKINASGAWDVKRDASNIKIAIVDDAVLTSHPDLSANIWINPNETINGIDDDGNGYIDDINGYDVSDNDNNPNPPGSATASKFSHGTHCAGIASASTNNGVGIASIGFNAKIIAVKSAPDASGGRTLPGAYKGVEYAIAANADIISMSWGGGSYSTTYQTLFNIAHGKGIVLVAAAGNSNVSTPMYPAAYNHVISVAATNNNDKKASFTNFGSTIDVSAPGVNIWSTVAGSTQYDYKSGTSMACPLVSGLCALMVANSPGISPDSVESCLKSTAKNINALNPTHSGQLGAGRIDAKEALNCTKGIVSSAFTFDKAVVCPGQSVQFDAKTPQVPGLTYSWEFQGGSPSTSASKSPTVTYNTAGTFSAKLTVTNANGSSVTERKDIIIVSTPTATISGVYDIEDGETAYVEIHFDGQQPFSFSYSDGSTTKSVSGITVNKYFLGVTPSDTTTYTITQFSDDNCAGNFSGTAIVNVIPTDSSCLRNVYSLSFKRQETVHIVRITMDDDENVYACGYGITGAGVYYGTLMKFSKNGKLQWFREYHGTRQFAFLTMAKNNNDVLLLGIDNQDQVIQRVDKDGNTVWTKRYNYSNERYYYGIVPSDNNSFIFGGMGTGAGGDDLYAIKINGSNGSIIWNYAFHKGDDQLAFVHSNGSDGVFFNGNSPSNGVFCELDKDGNMVQSHLVTGSANMQGLQRVGNYLFVTHASQRNSPVTLSVSMIDISNSSSPSVQWDKKIGITSRQWSEMLFSNENTGNVYLSYVGHTDQKAKILLLKQDGSLKEVHSADVNGSFKIAFKDRAMVMMISRRVGNESEIIMVKRRDTVGLDYCFLDDRTTTYQNSSHTFSAHNMTRSVKNFTVTNQNLSIQNGSLDASCLCATTSLTSSKSSICKGDSIQLEADGAGRYKWLPADGLRPEDQFISNPWVKPTKTTTYRVIVYNCECPKDTMDITIEVNGGAFKDLGRDTTICNDDTLTLQAEPGYSVYSWTPNYNMIHLSNWKKQVYPDVDTAYILTVTYASGCTSSDTVQVNVKSCCELDAQFVVDDNLVCLGETVNVTNLTQTNKPTTYNWTMPGASPSTFVGNNPGALLYNTPGNYEIELIATNPCGSDTVKQPLSIIDFQIDAGNDTSICIEDTIQIGHPEVSDHEYFWRHTGWISDAEIADPLVSTPVSGKYVLEVYNRVTGCAAKDSFYIDVIESLDLNISDTVLCEGQRFHVDVSGYDYDFTWSNGAQGPNFSTNEDGLVVYTATRNNCSFQDSFTVDFVTCSCIKFIPNVFTPNEDGKNETYKPMLECNIEDYHFMIYNRWGEKIFETFDQDAYWTGEYSGKRVPDGVYFWILEFASKRDQGKNRETLSGTVTLIR